MIQAMDDRIGLAQRHVTEGRKIVARQHQIVEQTEALGQDATDAKKTLDLFRQTLRIFEEDLNKLERGRLAEQIRISQEQVEGSKVLLGRMDELLARSNLKP
jgi:hypothetical protein